MSRTELKTIELDRDELRTWFGFGVAGNFAGHLEQAGEAADFVNVTSEGAAPKGIFPWYAPGSDGNLGEFPLSHDSILLPESETPLNLQIEPEVALACHVAWQGDTVVSLQPSRSARSTTARSVGRAHSRSVTRRTGARHPREWPQSSSTSVT
jgi:hypothetical protein